MNNKKYFTENDKSCTEVSDTATHLRFGNKSQAHYTLPVGNQEMYVLLGRPGQLTSLTVEKFDSGVLQQLQKRFSEVLATMPDYDDQPHVEAQLRVFQPGTYNESLDRETSSRMVVVRRETYHVHFQYGKHRVSTEFSSSRVDTETTRKAVNKLLVGILRLAESDENSDSIETTLEPAMA